MKLIAILFQIAGLLFILGAGIGSFFNIIPPSVSVKQMLIFGTVFVTTGIIMRRKQESL
jgi:flagellar motor component MotA